MSGARPTLGSQLRALRARLGLTLKEMSVRVDIPFSTLSKVEHDRLTLTYDKLQQLSERLNISMSDLFAGPQVSTRIQVSGRRSIGRISEALHVWTPNYDSYYLCSELRKKQMIPLLTRVTARSLEEFGKLVHHSGEEFTFVVEGAIEVHTEYYDPLVLSAGESVYIDSSMGHAYLLAEGADTALMLSVCSSSQEDLIASLPYVSEIGGAPTEFTRPERKSRASAQR